MNTVTIRRPIWDGGTKQRAVGVAEYQLPCFVNISYKDKHGDLIYPNKYLVTREKGMQYPVQVRRNVRLRIIPISELDEAPLIDNQHVEAVYEKGWTKDNNNLIEQRTNRDDYSIGEKKKPKQKRKGYKTMSLKELIEKYPPKEKEE